MVCKHVNLCRLHGELCSGKSTFIMESHELRAFLFAGRMTVQHLSPTLSNDLYVYTQVLCRFLLVLPSYFTPLCIPYSPPTVISPSSLSPHKWTPQKNLLTG